MSSENPQPYHVLAYYLFTTIGNPQAEVAKHQAFLKSRDIQCRVYISEEGINGQMSASAEASEEYQNWLKSDPRFASTRFKIHYHHEHAFPRVSVKYRKQIVAMDEKVDVSQTAEHLSPEKWQEMLKNRDENTIVLDVRNDYEWKIGHFEGSELPPLETFREFPKYARDLKKSRDPKQVTIMMCCTGGIRCEIYSALMKQEGFTNVYQLDGGIIGYGLQEGNKLWKGKLFVFDDRLAVPLAEEGGEVIGKCYHCNEPSDVYYNCSNMDCNELFLCCPSCAEKLAGCCSEACSQAPRLRKQEPGERPKPFRRSHLCSCVAQRGTR